MGLNPVCKLLDISRLWIIIGKSLHHRFISFNILFEYLTFILVPLQPYNTNPGGAYPVYGGTYPQPGGAYPQPGGAYPDPAYPQPPAYKY